MTNPPISNDPAAYITWYFSQKGWTLLPWQENLLRAMAKGKFVVFSLARPIGKRRWYEALCAYAKEEHKNE